MYNITEEQKKQIQEALDIAIDANVNDLSLFTLEEITKIEDAEKIVNNLVVIK